MGLCANVSWDADHSSEVSADPITEKDSEALFVCDSVTSCSLDLLKKKYLKSYWFSLPLHYAITQQCQDNFCWINQSWVTELCKKWSGGFHSKGNYCVNMLKSAYHTEVKKQWLWMCTVEE